jgi:AraC-like DNA-binding protein
MTATCTIHRPATMDMRARLLRQIDALIVAEMHRPLQLDEVARRLNVSRRQVQRIYAETTTLSFRAHLRLVRMRRAAELLRTTEMRVVEVAERVGYQQPAQFAKAFRSVHGVSPARFRAER